MFEFGGEIAWRPSPDYINHSRLKAFIDRHGLRDYNDLLARSITDPEWFWRAVLDDLGIEFYEPYAKVLDTSPGIAWTRWCVGGRMNIVHNCLDKWMGTPVADRIALRWEGEEGTTRTMTYAELRRDVSRFAAGLQGINVRKGDRVALFMPMCPELIIAFLAVIRIGGIVLPLFSGYGAEAVATRLRDSESTLLVTADGFWRRGQQVLLKPVVDEAVAAAPSCTHVVLASRLGVDVPVQGRDVGFRQVMVDAECPNEPTGAEDPLMLIYTSGTTGRPKGAVHTHCGFPIKAAQDMAHCFDVHDGETMYWVSDMGWMMGPWEVFGMLLLGGTSVIYDGALDYPGPDRLWSIVERHRVNILGVSPTLVRALIPKGEPTTDLSSLRALTTTGEPWNAGPYDWLNEHVAGGGRIPIVNISGGTEVGACFLSVTPMAPTKPVSLGFPALGQAMDVYGPDGAPLRGEVGELVCTRPWPGMTRGIWRDDERYLEAYWRRFPGVWTHGDWASVDEDGYWYLHGRSDDTLNIAGKRIGPAELESAALDHPSVAEAAAIGVPHEVKGETAWLFCALKPGAEQDPDGIRAAVAAALGKPFAPERVLFVSALPKTRSAKIVRRAVRAKALGEDPGDVSTLENPEILEEIARAV